MYMKKLLDSDWLRAVQFKCNTSAKGKGKVITKILCGNFETELSLFEKSIFESQKRLSAF